jgi:hypothetical protein
LEFVAIDITRPENQMLVDLYKANKKRCAIIELGQGKSHGMVLISRTKPDDYPNGFAWECINKAKKASTPSDASAVIELEMELERLQLKDARDFYNDMVRVMDRYEVMTDCEMCMLMADTNQDATYG